MTKNSSSTSRRWLKLFLKTGSAIGLGLFVVAIIGIAYGQSWAKSNLAPLISQELTKSLKRPVQLGKIEDIWLNEIKISATTIPAHGTDRNNLKVDRVIVNFDPIKFAIARTVKLDIRAIAPSIYIEQNRGGNWVDLPKIEQKPSGEIKVEVGSINVEDGRITILPYRKNPQPIELSKVNLDAQIDNSQQRVNFNGNTQFQTNGRLEFQGNSSIATGETQLTAKGQKLDAAAATQIIKIPEVEIVRGTVDGDASVAIQPQKSLRVNSNLFVNNGKLTINNVPRSLENVTGAVRVTEREVNLNNVAAKYDRVNTIANGTLNYSTGYQLDFKTAPSPLTDIFKSIDVRSPFILGGAAVSQLQLTGKLDRPILTGKFQNSQISQVDRVRIERVDGNFKLADGRIRVDAIVQPKLGGKITTTGEIKLLKIPQTRFAIAGNDLPGDALTQLYGAKLPPEIKLGKTSVAGTIGGTGGDIYTNLRVSAPESNYPTIADLQITPQGKTIVRDATIQAAGGKVNITGEVDKTNWRLNLQPQDLDTQQLAKIVGATLPVNYAGKLVGNLQASGLNSDLQLISQTAPLEKFVRASGGFSVSLAAGKVITDRLVIDRGKWQANVSSNAVDLQQLDRSLPSGMASGNFNLGGTDLRQITSDNLQATGQGQVKLVAGTIRSSNLAIANGNWQGKFTTDKLQLAKLNPQVGGNLSGAFDLAGSLQKFTPASIRGNGKGTLDLPQGKVTGNNFQIDRGKWQGNLQSTSLVLGGLAPQIPSKYRNATISGNVAVAGDLQQLRVEQINVSGNARLNLDGGTIIAKQLDINSGKWQGNFTVDRLKLGSTTAPIPTEFAAARLSGNFAVTGDLTKFEPSRATVAGNGELDLDSEKIRAKNLKLERGNLSSDLAIANFKLGRVNNTISPQLQAGKVTGNFKVTGNINRLTPLAIQASGNGNVKLPTGGEIIANNLQLTSGNWQSDLAIRGLRLGDVNRDLAAPMRAGLLAGNFRAAGNLRSPTPEQLQVSGSGNLQNILGGKVIVANLTLANGRWQSKINADRLNLAELAKFAPNQNLDPKLLTGRLSTDWQVDGNLNSSNPASLRVIGQTKISDLQAGSLKFDPNLIGNVSVNPGQGVDLKFVGINDRLELALDRNLQLQSFAIDKQGVSAIGNVNNPNDTSGNRILDIAVERFPLPLIQTFIPQNTNIQQYRFDGSATGKLALNLNNYQVTGDRIEITKPIFGAFQGDRLLANFRYANGRFNLDNTEVQRGDNSYLINASVDPLAKTPTFQAKLQVAKGNLEDVRNLFQVFSFEDLVTPFNRRKYGTAADLQAKNERLAERPQPLYNELRGLSELRRWLDRERARQQDTTSIPELRNLQGDFSGELTLANNSTAGLTANFNIVGDKWRLERYYLDRLQATGSVRNGQLQLEPLKIAIKNTQMTLAGKFGLDNQSASINIQNFPAKWFRNVIDSPVDFQGGIDLAAQISGEMGNPNISGNIALREAKLERIPLETATGSFNYLDGRLNFNSSASFVKKLRLEDRDDSIKIAGSIPYQLPFTQKSPASDSIKIEIGLQDRGLQMLDVFSKKQLHWLDGQGKVAVQIDGKMKPNGEIKTLLANGIATISNGSIEAEAIPEPIKNINGEIVFDFDRIDVRKLEGKFDRGRVAISGILPIADSFSIEPDKKLSVEMNDVALDLKDKYKGNVNGKLTILGTAFKPTLGGELKLSNGQVSLPESPNTTSTILGIKPIEPADAPPTTDALELRNLQVVLGDNLQITRAPILSFVATGKIDIDGTLDNPRPFGQVQLQKGSVNIFTTQFRLASGPQTADFFPTLGTDPVLNLRLYSKILESTSSPLSQRNSIARTATNGEIDRPADFYTTSLGSVQTVQVEARIAGLASQITQRLELTSSPVLTQPEIVLLLGGGLVERIGSGGDIGLGIANLAGSNILNSIQDRISDIFSLSDFRLFPTTIREAKSTSNSTFGIAAEVGTEITPRLSTSVFKILTNNESLYYSLRYRINDQMLLRGSTNLYGENRAILEFEQRF
jgi:translocation and assembly module TamB